MSLAVAVSHGAFGRAAFYQLDRQIITHAHREGHLIFHLAKSTACVTVNDAEVLIDNSRAAAVSP